MMARNPFQTVLYYSLAMISLPIIAYFMSKSVLETITNRQSANIYSTIISVIVVHIVLFGFVYCAYSEDKHLSTEKISKASDKTD